MAEDYFVYDPRKMITSPFSTCPFCGGAEYGLLMVSHSGYVRRCRDCMKDEQFRLPQIEKKVLYLDQFVVSELMKVVHPDYRAKIAAKGTQEERFWLGLFDRLEYLVKMHVLVCPWSEAHWEESYAWSAAFQQLRRVYEHLSGDVRFEDPAHVKHSQVMDAFKRWLGHTPGRPLTRRDVLRGNLDGWNDRLAVHARLDPGDDVREELAQHRSAVHTGLKAVFDRWQTEPRRDFEDYFREEVAAYGPSQLRGYADRLKEIVAVFETGADPLTLLASSPSQILIHSMRETLEQDGVGQQDQIPRIKEFFASDAVSEIPAIGISCGLFAALAVAASLNQAAVPNRGMATDVNVVATYLPYCDAMIIDRECERLLRYADERLALIGETTVISLADRPGLFAWLDELAAGIPDEHHNLVKEVYGPSWTEPYREIFTPR